MILELDFHFWKVERGKDPSVASKDLYMLEGGGALAHTTVCGVCCSHLDTAGHYSINQP